jgi:hypothetical protein
VFSSVEASEYATALATSGDTIGVEEATVSFTQTKTAMRQVVVKTHAYATKRDGKRQLNRRQRTPDRSWDKAKTFILRKILKRGRRGGCWEGGVAGDGTLQTVKGRDVLMQGDVAAPSEPDGGGALRATEVRLPRQPQRLNKRQQPSGARVGSSL